MNILLSIIVLPNDLTPADKLRLLFADKNTNDKIAWIAFLDYTFKAKNVTEAGKEIVQILDSMQSNRPFLHHCAMKIAAEGFFKISDVEFFSIIANQNDHDDRKFKEIYLTSKFFPTKKADGSNYDTVAEMISAFTKEVLELIKKHRPEIHKEWFEKK